jgi:hypothetical protein
MPTGYTAGILDGTTKDFTEFAKHCSRAFMIHMRDESFDSEYKKIEPSDYHTKAITKAKEKLKQANLITDKELVTQGKIKLIDSKKYHLEAKVKDDANKIKMELFLDKAKAYNPPTETHKGIGKFMIEQLEGTIDFDCNRSYHIDELKTIDNKIDNVNADDIRSEMIVSATKDIAYHTEANEKELKGCRESNKWYEDFINSIQ